MFFVKNSKILNDEGLSKLSTFRDSLFTLKTQLEHSKTTDSETLGWCDNLDPNTMQDYIFLKDSGYLSSAKSEAILNQAIFLLNTLIENNSVGHWRENTKNNARITQLCQFFDLFSDSMNNYSPECFDVLSATIAKKYFDFLDTISLRDFDNKKALAFSGFEPTVLIRFVEKNTTYSLHLFQLSARSMRLKAQGEETNTHFMQLQGNLILLLTFFSAQSKNTVDESFYSSFKKAYQFFFNERPNNEEINSLDNSVIIARAIEQYNQYVTHFLPTICLTFDRLDSIITSPHLLTSALEHNQSELTHTLVPTINYQHLPSSLITHDQRFIALCLVECPTFPIHTLLKFSDTIKGQYSFTNALKYLEKFYVMINALQTSLFHYYSTPKLSRDKFKEQLAKELRDQIIQIFDSRLGNPKFIAHYIEEALAALLRTNFLHQLLVRQKNISYGTLGIILSDALAHLFEIIKTYDITADPAFSYFCLTQMPSATTEQTTFKYPCIIQSGKNKIDTDVKDFWGEFVDNETETLKSGLTY